MEKRRNERKNKTDKNENTKNADALSIYRKDSTNRKKNACMNVRETIEMPTSNGKKSNRKKKTVKKKINENITSNADRASSSSQ